MGRKRKPLQIIRDVDTGVLYIHAKDTGIHPLIILNGEVPVMIPQEHANEVLVKIADAASWHEREAEHSSGKTRVFHAQAAQAMRTRIQQDGGR